DHAGPNPRDVPESGRSLAASDLRSEAWSPNISEELRRHANPPSGGVPYGGVYMSASRFLSTVNCRKFVALTTRARPLSGTRTHVVNPPVISRPTPYCGHIPRPSLALWGRIRSVAVLDSLDGRRSLTDRGRHGIVSRRDV